MLWGGFGTGKYFRYYYINGIYKSLGSEKSQALHTFTGASQLYGMGRKIAWESWKSYTEVTKPFLSVTIQPFSPLHSTSEAMKLLERYTCILYHK